MKTTLTQAYIRQIMSYDPATGKLSVNYHAPVALPSIHKVNKYILNIDGVNYSLARLAYLYHFGQLLNIVLTLDRNRANCAPENLRPPAYKKLPDPMMDYILNSTNHS